MDNLLRGAAEDDFAAGGAAEGKEGATEIDEATFAEGGLAAVVDVEGREDAHGVVYFRVGYLPQILAHLCLGVVAAVHLRHKTHTTLLIGVQLVAAYVCFSCGLFVHCFISCYIHTLCENYFT